MIWPAVLSLLLWLGLLTAHGRFWRADQRLAETPGVSGPRVVAVVPARNEAAVIAKSVGSLLSQDYDGLHVVVVDDQSGDGTAEIARDAAAQAAAADRLTVIQAAPLPPGWSGKMWAVSQGVTAAAAREPDYLWLTDADIAHAPRQLSRLVAKAEAERLDLVSLMVLLNVASVAEKLLVPAFVFFFQKLYPFPKVNDPSSRVAGAAGGCMLVRRAALERAGGIAAIRGALIDDCALARRLKARGPIWLGLTRASLSLRPYPHLADIWAMVARTAYTQLNHSPLLLVGTVLAMALIYLVPPLAALIGAVRGEFGLAAAGAAGWAAMAVAYRPTLELYRMPWWRALTLPLAGLLYTLMTVDSARRHWLGRGGGWKGRTYAGAAS